MTEEQNPGAVNYGRWTAATLGLIVVTLLTFAAVTIYIDPLFHYHKPLEQYEYPLNLYERYQNPGILRHFDYNGLIIGSSMTGEFKASEAESFFGVPFVKTCFASAFYQEINDNLEIAYAAGKDIQIVIRGLDLDYQIMSKPYSNRDEYVADLHTGINQTYQLPEYLYNENPLDDVNYFLNKSIFMDRTLWVFDLTRSGGKSTTFDEYGIPVSLQYGPEIVLKYTLSTPHDSRPMTEELRELTLQNIRQSVTDLTDKHPETDFYLFFSPYSICWWDRQNNAGAIDLELGVLETAIEELLLHPNIHLYSFSSNFQLVCDLDNYRDTKHYGRWINSWMLEQMYNGNYLLTKDNYMEHLATMREFYISYDYASLHGE